MTTNSPRTRIRKVYPGGKALHRAYARLAIRNMRHGDNISVAHEKERNFYAPG